MAWNVTRIGRGLRRQGRRFARDERGGTAIEYSLIAALVFLVCSTGLLAYSANLKLLYEAIGGAVAGKS